VCGRGAGGGGGGEGELAGIGEQKILRGKKVTT